MSSGTIDRMKVLAVKGIEKFGNLWEVRYTRLTRRGMKQEAYFLCDSQQEAQAKRDELLDVLQHHDGMYVSKKAQKKVKARQRKPLTRELLNPSYERLSGSISALRAWNILSQELRKLMVQGLEWKPARHVTMIRNTQDGSWQLWPGDTTEGKPLLTFKPYKGGGKPAR
jgi:hypothetical protein